MNGGPCRRRSSRAGIKAPTVTSPWTWTRFRAAAKKLSTNAAERGARLPTEDEWQLAAQQGLIERREPLTWNWTESEHSDGITRFALLKGGSAFRAEGSEWYVDGGPQAADFSLKYLLPGPLQRSSRIGFRLAVDL